jgi:acetamidase/formamidase
MTTSRDVDLTVVHNLSGPVAVEGAEPGDGLVDILDGAYTADLTPQLTRQTYYVSSATF